MFGVLNDTACQVHAQLMLDGQAEERLLVVAKASYSIEVDRLVPIEAELTLADRYRGDPARSSLLAAGEVVLAKPSVDLLLSGSAYPARPGETSGHVLFRVGSWSKDAVVFGDRTWTRGVTGLRPGAPQPFTEIPLIYERAFGGSELSCDSPLECAENPVGVGLVDCRVDAPLPNLEHPRRRLEAPGERPPPRGFGPIAPHWQPRRGLHGSVDAAWQRTRLPPLDADPRAAQVAPPDQVLPGPLRGDEEVELRGVRPDGDCVQFKLPGLRVRVTVQDGERRLALPTMLDTLHVDADALRLDLTWRASTSVHERVDELEWIRVEAGAAHG